MSPQRSNRDRLIEGTLRCLERLPAERVTARAIAAEAGANLASIPYHFETKDRLVTEAVIVGLDRWLAELDRVVSGGRAASPAERFRQAARFIDATLEEHEGLAATFVDALARARHDARVRDLLVDGFRRTRPAVAGALGLGDDAAGEDAAGLVHSMFVGLLAQAMLARELNISGERMGAALARLRAGLPDGAS